MRAAYAGRHRLGTPGLVHCVMHREVAEAIEDYRRSWLTAWLKPAKHSWMGLRRKARSARKQTVLAPAT